MKFPTMQEVAAYSDAEIGEFLNHAQQIKDLRQELGELVALEGKAKEEAEQMWQERMAPRISSESLRWIKEDAMRAANPKKVLASTSPDSIF